MQGYRKLGYHPRYRGLGYFRREKDGKVQRVSNGFFLGGGGWGLGLDFGPGDFRPIHSYVLGVFCFMPPVLIRSIPGDPDPKELLGIRPFVD